MSFRKQYEIWYKKYGDIENPPVFIPSTEGIEWEVEKDIYKSLLKKKKKQELRMKSGTKHQDKIDFFIKIYNKHHKILLDDLLNNLTEDQQEKIDYFTEKYNEDNKVLLEDLLNKTELLLLNNIK